MALRISELPNLDPGVALSGGAYVPISMFQYGVSGTLMTFKTTVQQIASVALSAATGTGFVVYNGGGYVNRTLGSGTGITVNNGDGSANPTFDLNSTAVTPGTYGTITSLPSFTVDQQGRLTAASNISFSAGGTIVSIQTSSGLTGGPITYSGTIGIDTGVLVTLTNAQTLQNKTYSGGTFSGVLTFAGVTISGNFTLSGVLSGGTFSGSTLSGGSVVGGTLQSVTLTGSNILATTLSGGTISGSTLSAVTINGSTITGGSTINNTAIGATVSSTVSATTNQVITLKFGDGTTMQTAATGGGGTDVLQVQVFS